MGFFDLLQQANKPKTLKKGFVEITDIGPRTTYKLADQNRDFV